MTEREIVIETLLYYRTGDRFGIQNGTCLYLDPQTGNRCAVGRCLQTDRFDYSRGDVYGLHDEGFRDEDLKPQYRGHPVGFWSLLQQLHDLWSEFNSILEFRRDCSRSLLPPVLKELQKRRALLPGDLLLVPEFYPCGRHD